MTASKTVALPLGDSTINWLVFLPFTNSVPTHHRWLETYVAPIKQTPDELHIIPSIRCIAPGQTQAYKPVSVKKCSLTICSKGSHFERSRLSPFSTIYPCEALTAPHVGFSSYFYMRTELPKVMLAGIVHHPPIRLMTNRALLRFRCYCYTSTVRPI